MKIFLYYTETQSKTLYGDTGTFDVMRYIQGFSRFWRLDGFAKVSKPKKLVLSDWSAETWSNDKIERVIKALDQLLDEGFEVYISQGEELHSLKKEALAKTLKSLASRQRITPKHPDDLIRQAVKAHKIRRDELYFLDDHGLRQVLESVETPTPKRHLLFSDLEAIEKEPDVTRRESRLEQLMAVLLKSRPPLTAILNDLSMKQDVSWLLAYFIKHYPSIPVKQYKENCLLEGRAALDLVEAISRQEKDALSRISSVKHLKLKDCTLTASQLELLLKHTPYVEDITLDDCIIKEGAFSEGKLVLSKVFHIEITGEKSDISETTLSSLLMSCNKRRFVYLREGLTTIRMLQEGLSYSNVLSIDCFKAKGLKARADVIKTSTALLESFGSSFSDISFYNLIQCIDGVNTLRDLYLAGCCLTDEVDKASFKLKGIWFMNLNQSEITPKNFKMLVEGTTILRRLSLCHCQVLSQDFEIDNRVWASLEVIDLDGRYLTIKHLKTILSAAPHLKQLQILYPEHLALTPELKDRIDAINKQAFPSDLEYTKCTRNKRPVPTNLQTLETMPSTIPSADAPSLSKDSPIQDTVHDPAKSKVFTPPSEDADFTYKGLNKTKNQGMIIEKLSQYLQFQSTEPRVIAKLQVGICESLTRYFLEHAIDDWDRMIEAISSWDGTKETMTTVSPVFKELYEKYVQENPLPLPQYLGDNLSSFLTHSEATSCLLRNPWHAISIRRKRDGFWEIYDPNYVAGYRVVPASQLLEAIHLALGPLVFVYSQEVIVQPRVDNTSLFLEEGGLLALHNMLDPSLLIEQLSAAGDFSKQALDGLLFRDNKGIPAWVKGFKNSKLAQLTQQLIAQFIKKNPKDWKSQLETSMACLEALDRHFLIDGIVRASIDAEPSPVVAVVRDIPHLTRYFEDQLQTWETEKPGGFTLLSYAQDCLKEIGKKRLIELSCKDDVRAMQQALQKNSSRPVFYIHSPDELICSKPWIERGADNEGILHKGPGGALYRFLMENQDQAPILIVNYDAFTPEELVRCNGLLDKSPSADGVLLPDGTSVIGLLNINQPDCYQGSDFYSRFDKRHRQPITSHSLETNVLILPIEEKTPVPLHEEDIPSDAADTPYVIDLCHSSAWKEKLLGRWTLQGDRLIFQEGELIKALNSKRAIEIRNGLWEDDEFNQFWHQAYLTGTVDHGAIAFPKDQRMFSREGYPWKDLIKQVRVERGTPNLPVLNPSSVESFYSRYSVEGALLKSLPGLIEQSTGKTLTVTMTHKLSVDEWARLLLACKKHAVQLLVHCAPGVSLPDELGIPYHGVEPVVPPWNQAPLLENATQIIQSSDPDATVALLTRDEIDWTVIDVSECSPSDLLERIDGEVNEGAFLFNERPSYLKNVLSKGGKVILKGRFSKELSDMLAALLLERSSATRTTGSLILVPEDGTSFQYYPRAMHQVNVRDKRALLGETQAARLDVYLASESFPVLQARAKDVHLGEGSWAGLRTLPGGVPGFKPLDHMTADSDTETFIQDRKKAIHRVLHDAPYVFIAGISGVGKSTFVSNELCEEGDKVFHGDEELADWIKETDKPGYKYLFMDEANLKDKDWSECEGLFNKPPTIFYKGKLYPLTDRHKIIFAGNPISYGDERKLAPFFQKHGNAVVFSPLTLPVIYKKILCPIFEGTEGIDESTMNQINAQILQIYECLCAYSTTEVLISPRELQMIALLIRRAHLRPRPDDPKMSLVALAKRVAYDLTAHLVPENKRQDFSNRFNPGPPPKADSEKLGGFLVTASRQPIHQMIQDLLALRELRRSSPGNSAQQYGGLGGIVLEGEPGEGKSELVIASLIAAGYEEKKWVSTEIGSSLTPDALQSQKYFYRLPANMDPQQKKDLELQAFHEGSVVLVDEINSSPMMEEFRNNLYMGQGPNAERPRNPGLTYIGTQNPITMAGRRAPSTAIARRLRMVIVENYTREEQQAILESEGLLPSVAASYVEAFQTQLDYAKKRHLSPLPTFRDVLNQAKPILTFSTAHQAVYLACATLLGEIESLSTQLNVSVTEIVGQKKRLVELSLSECQDLQQQLDKDLMALKLRMQKKLCHDMVLQLRKEPLFKGCLAHSTFYPDPNFTVSEPLLDSVTTLIDSETELSKLEAQAKGLQMVLKKSKEYINAFYMLENDRLGLTIMPLSRVPTDEEKKSMMGLGRVYLFKGKNNDYQIGYMDTNGQYRCHSIDSDTEKRALDDCWTTWGLSATDPCNFVEASQVIKATLKACNIRSQTYNCRVEAMTIKHHLCTATTLPTYNPSPSNNSVFLLCQDKIYHYEKGYGKEPRFVCKTDPSLKAFFPTEIGAIKEASDGAFDEIKKQSDGGLYATNRLGPFFPNNERSKVWLVKEHGHVYLTIPGHYGQDFQLLWPKSFRGDIYSRMLACPDGAIENTSILDALKYSGTVRFSPRQASGRLLPPWEMFSEGASNPIEEIQRTLDLSCRLTEKKRACLALINSIQVASQDYEPDHAYYVSLVNVPTEFEKHDAMNNNNILIYKKGPWFEPVVCYPVMGGYRELVLSTDFLNQFPALGNGVGDIIDSTLLEKISKTIPGWTVPLVPRYTDWLLKEEITTLDKDTILSETSEEVLDNKQRCLQKILTSMKDPVKLRKEEEIKKIMTAMTNIIQSYRTRANEFGSYKMNAKADKILEALQQVPRGEITNLLESDETVAVSSKVAAVWKAMGLSRRTLLLQSDVIDTSMKTRADYRAALDTIRKNMPSNEAPKLR